MLLRHNLIVVITISSLFGVQSRNRIRDPYRFNHPPSIETVESVPVAVAYKSGDAREEKSINLSANFRTTSEEDLHSTKNYEKAVPSYIQNKSSDVAEPEKIENKNIARSSNRKSSTRLNLEIPVNVVYDTESGVVDADKGSDQSVTTSIKKLNHFTRRLQKSKIGQSSMDEVAIIDNKLKEKESIENTAFIESLSSLSIQNNPISSPEPKSIGLERKGMRTRAPVVPIVTEKNFVYAHSGKFHYSFEGGDGTKVFEEGSLKTINDEAGEAVHGGFSYTDEEGNDYSLSYTADENGYQPIGAHLPTSPPIPPAIARALAYLATKTIPQTTEATRKLA